MTEEQDQQFLREIEEAQKQDLYPEYPEPEKKENFLTLFKWLIKREDATRFGFLSKEQIGNPDIHSLGLQRLALQARVIGEYNIVSDYLMEIKDQLHGTSLSRDGFMMKQPSSMIKKQEISMARKSGEEKSGGFLGFGKKKESEGGA